MAHASAGGQERFLSCGHRNHHHGVGSRLLREPFHLPGTTPRYAPDRTVDVRHTRLEVRVDPARRLLAGRVTHRVAALDAGVTLVTLHAEELAVLAVTDAQGRALASRHAEGRLVVTLPQPLALGEEASIVVAYEGTPRRGLYFIAPDASRPDKPLQAWTQGQDEDSRFWFPCFDHPQEKASTEVLARVPQGMKALSNGALVGTQPHGDGTVTWHWRQSLPHSAYLVTLVVGEFEEVSLPHPRVPLSVWVRREHAARVPAVFGRTAAMLDTFERRFGTAYPWEKYAQVVVEDFIFGGMENTSATTLVDVALYDERAGLDYDADDLLAHELAHQWWGDLLTCRDWPHAWLNEGFATWSETVFKEDHLGPDEAAYERHTQRLGYLDEDGGEYRRAIVDRRYADPIDLFDRHLYEKGSCVLHMLRKELGEEPFWRAIRTYAATHRGGSVVTEDLVRAIERATGRNLEWFMEQWVLRGGHPELTVGWSHDAAKGLLTLSVRQGQAGDELTPDTFRFHAEVLVAFEGGKVERQRVEVTRRDQALLLPCRAAPERVVFDPDGDLLATLEVEAGADAQRAMLASGPTAISRLRAAAHLAKDATEATVAALARALHDPFWGVGAEAAAALGRIRTPAARAALVEGLAGVKHPKARRAVAAALGAFRGDMEAGAALVRVLERGDASYFVEAAAAAALGAVRTPGALEALSGALATKDAWMEVVRIGCVRGLAALGDERAVPLLVERLAPTQMARLRSAAAGALAQLGRRMVQREALREALVELLHDASFPVLMAGIAALRVLGDERALGALGELAESGGDGRVRRAARVAAARIGRGAERTREVARLADELEAMRRTHRDLLGRMERLEAGARPGGKAAGAAKGKASARAKARAGGAGRAGRRGVRKGGASRRRR